MKTQRTVGVVTVAAIVLLAGCGKQDTDAHKEGYHNPASLSTLVESEMKAPDFVDNGDGTVTDKSNRLMWQQDDYGEAGATREDGSLYCEELELAGHRDWRLPTCTELKALVDSTRSDPAIDTGHFPTAKSTRYWASDLSGYFGSHKMFCLVDFKTGISGGVYETTNPVSGDGRPKCVRCVRGSGDSQDQ